MRHFALLSVLGLVGAGASCGGPLTPTGRDGQLSGELHVTEGSRGSAWVFLYAPNQGPPLSAAFPDQVTAVPDVRLREGDTRYVFAEVEPNAYRVWSFLDTNEDLETGIDVLGGPGAGDRISAGVELNLQPGQRAQLDLEVRQHVRHEPPAFTVANFDAATTMELPDQVGSVIAFELRAEALGILDADRTAFVISLGDGDADGLPDDANADGIPDLFPQIYLRFLRKPGQVVPLDSRGNPAEVIVPLAFDPGAFLATLASDPEASVVTDRLNALVLPQAQAITYEGGRGRVVTPMDAIPVGDYELWVVSESGQWWRLPNDLHTDYPSQGARFRFVHGPGNVQAPAQR